MKKFTLSVLCFLTFIGINNAQNTVRDLRPTASIYTFDYQSGQEILATDDAAILFKNALIDLVTNTNSARQQLKLVPGRRSFVITQADPKTGYAYQLTYQAEYLKQVSTIYTFLYNADQNTLYFYNNFAQNWLPEQIRGANVANLNNCQALSGFNNPKNYQPPVQGNAQPAAYQTADDNAPVDTSVSATDAPPALPDYNQPECPGDGYLWQPGYWAYSADSNGYYWVPGVWVSPPSTELLWTPPYWEYNGVRYVFHNGYWGNSIGFYGGVNYGYGYGGAGFYGGEWREGHFRYNTAVLRVSINVHNTYVNNTVIINRNVNHTSFNGRGGIIARPTAGEIQAMHEHHVMATSEQIRNQRAARADRTQFASANNGRPGNLAAARPPVNNASTRPGAFGRPGGPAKAPEKSGKPKKSVEPNKKRDK